MRRLLPLLLCLLIAGPFAIHAQDATPEPVPQADPPIIRFNLLELLLRRVEAEAQENPAAQAVPAAVVLTTDERYTVMRGDRLADIAARYGVTVACVAQANNLANPNIILVGQELLIPASCQGGGGGGAGGGSVATVTGEGITGGGTCQFDRYPGRVAPGGAYTIRAGDTLDFIACDFGIALSCLVESNPQIGANRGSIRAGDTLTINLACPAWEGAPIP